MRDFRQRSIDIRRVPKLRVLTAGNATGPVIISSRGRPSHVLLRVEVFERLGGKVGILRENTKRNPPAAPDEQRFTVLCRIDAWADYVAEVAAETADEAAELARENHGDYDWGHSYTQEFDARRYVTLDADDNEIESTAIGDF